MSLVSDSRRNDAWYRNQHGGAQLTIARLLEENRLLRADKTDLENENALLRSMLAVHGWREAA